MGNMNERNLVNVKPEKWNNIPVCMVEAFRLMINDNLRLDESTKEVVTGLEDLKNRNDNKIKKLQQETKKSIEDTNLQVTKTIKNNDVLHLQTKDLIKRDKESLQTIIDDK